MGAELFEASGVSVFPGVVLHQGKTTRLSSRSRVELVGVQRPQMEITVLGLTVGLAVGALLNSLLQGAAAWLPWGAGMFFTALFVGGALLVAAPRTSVRVIEASREVEVLQTLDRGLAERLARVLRDEIERERDHA